MVAAHVLNPLDLSTPLPAPMARLLSAARHVAGLDADYARAARAINVRDYVLAAEILELTVRTKTPIIRERLGVELLAMTCSTAKKLRFLHRMLANGFPPSAEQLEEFWNANGLGL